MYTLHVLVREGGRSRRPHTYEHSRWNLRTIVLQELYKQGSETFQHWLRSNEAYLEIAHNGYQILNVPREFIKPFIGHQARWMISRLRRWKSFFMGRAIDEYKEINLIFLVD